MMPEPFFELLGGADAQGAVPLMVHVAFLGGAMALCLAIGIVDARRRIIPDPLNALLAVLGLLLASLDGLDAAMVAALGGLAGFTAFWAFRRLYRALRGVQGLGFGDVKFVGAAGIWVGAGGLAPLVLVACLAALTYVAIAGLRGQSITGRSALPFGPFLALGLAAVLGVPLVWSPDA